MKTFSIITATAVALGIGSYLVAAGNPAGGKQFMAKIIITKLIDGKPTVIGEPTLMARDGQEASFLAGGEVPVEVTGKDFLSFGLKARVKVHEVKANELRVMFYAGNAELDVQKDSSVIIREQGVHCVKTVKPGERIELDLGGGRTVSARIEPVAGKS